MREWLLVPAGLLAAIAVAALDQEAGLRAWRERGVELSAARERIGAARAEVERLRAEVAALEGEPFALERAIREDLGFAKPGETVVLLPGSEASHFR